MIKFNTPFIPLQARNYIADAFNQTNLEVGKYTRLASCLLEEQLGATKVLLTNSCTAALELAALLINVQPGDEIIMPSYTFVSSANAFVLRGGVPIFVDIRKDTLNIDEKKIEAAITKKTKAILPMHYAGVGCEMSIIMEIAKKYSLYVIEDNAQGIHSAYKNKPLGSFGHLSTLSFHHTKNITAGLGGALAINDASLVERAKILWQKGTNREAFDEGKIDRYTWVDIGSSMMPSEMTAAFLYAGLQELGTVTLKRLSIWEQYHEAFTTMNIPGIHQHQYIPDYCQHNGHIYYLVLTSPGLRDNLITLMKQAQVELSSHYIPLHLSPAGKQFAKCYSNTLSVTDFYHQRLVRLPLHLQLSQQDVKYSIESIYSNLKE